MVQSASAEKIASTHLLLFFADKRFLPPLFVYYYKMLDINKLLNFSFPNKYSSLFMTFVRTKMYQTLNNCRENFSTFIPNFDPVGERNM